MASRKDELNAYTFARKRTVAAFLRPSPTGTEEGAPRPLRAIVPSLVVGALVMAGFGAWGMIKPAVPKDWDTPGRNVIIGSDSTTRYVVLETDGTTQLHPVLNLSSARLLLHPDTFNIVSVDEKELDSGELPQGPTLGIPYAPDRLPSAEDAAEAKRWAVCQHPGGDGETRQAVFVFAERDAERVDGRGRLNEGEVLYVEGENNDSYLVDWQGVRYQIAGGEGLARSLVGEVAPQPVTKDWLATFDEGSPIDFPDVPGAIGASAGVAGLEPAADQIGMVLRAPTGAGPQHYLVLSEQVVPVSDFTARLLLDSAQTAQLGQRGAPLEVGAQSFTPAPASESIDVGYHWPTAAAVHVNKPADEGQRDTVCSVLRGVDPQNGTTELSTWAGTGFPATIADGSTTAYVTPGSGLMYRQVQGAQAEAGGLFLVTDTGLRYAIQANSDSDRAGPEAVEETEQPADTEEPAPPPPEDNQAQIRLGYQNIEPVPVPAHWSEFLPTGPRLDTKSARQPQGF